MNKIIETIRTLAAEQPAFIYQNQPERSGFRAGNGSCSYVGAVRGRSGGQGCIIGQALQRNGVSVEALAQVEDPSGVAVTDLAHMRPEWFGETTFEERGWMGEVQFQQDKGASWEFAVQEADRRFPPS